MRPYPPFTAAVVAGLLTAVLAPITPGFAAHPAVPTPSTTAASGAFSVLTYNIAGLPEGISSGNPAANTTPIGQRIPAFDIVHVQEDFNYHAALYAADTHAYRTPTSGGAAIGDGLNTLSDHPFQDFTRVDWNNCNGTDCLTPKGFTWMRVRLDEGVFVDFYNAHPNAGTTAADLAARRANITQLSNYIAANSAGNAVVVMGDTNTRYTRAGDNIRDLVSANGLTDAWVRYVRGGVPPAVGSDALVCDDTNVTDACEVVDKILFRGSRLVRLTLGSYHNEDAAFRTASDQPLSDHYPISARFAWSLDPDLRQSDLWGGPHGTPFTDADRVVPRGVVGAISLRAGSRVDQVGLELAGGTVLNHGGTGGTAARLALGSGEYLTGVTLARGQKDGRTRVFYARFVTNLSRSLAGGTPTADSVTYTAPPGWQIGGFFGRSGSEVDQLGVISTPAP